MPAILSGTKRTPINQTTGPVFQPLAEWDT